MLDQVSRGIALLCMYDCDSVMTEFVSNHLDGGRVNADSTDSMY